MQKILLFIVIALLSTPTWAVEEVPNIDSIQEFASLIRWGGVLFSIVIIACTWVLLRFIDSIVESVSAQFVQYRMLLQKAQSFFQFFIYVTAGLVVFMISFRINDHILALIGGTLAVSVGFAL